MTRHPGRALASACAVLALALQLTADSASAGGGPSGFEKKFVEVAAGEVYSGIQPGGEQDYDFLKSRGIKTLLNLRRYLRWSERTMHDRAKAHGFFYRHAGMPTMWNEPKDPEVQEALDDINDRSLQPIYVHCRLGKDRTGMIIALHRVIHQRWDACSAWKAWTGLGYKPWNFGLKDYYEKRLRRETAIVNFDPNFSVGRCR